LSQFAFALQDGAAAVAKQSKKGKKDVPVSQYPSEVKLHVYFVIVLCVIFQFLFSHINNFYSIEHCTGLHSDFYI